MRASLVAAALAVLTIGCTNSMTPADAGPDLRAPGPDLAQPPFCTASTDAGEPPPTLASVETLFAANCAIGGCHDNDPCSPRVQLDLRPGHVYASVVNVNAVESACGGKRVVPGDPTKSYLFHKLADADPCNGTPCQLPDGTMCIRMPRCEDGSCPLPPCAIDVVRRWIAAGAPMQ